MKTYARSVFLPLIGLQILFKNLDAFLNVIYSRLLHSAATLSQSMGNKVLGLTQLVLIASPLILFLGYKYFHKHMIPFMVLLMCFLISCVGLQWGDPLLLHGIQSIMQVLIEGVLFWQLALLTTSKDKALWTFPFYVLLASAVVMLIHKHWSWEDQIDMGSLTNLYGIVAVLVIAIISIVYRFQTVNEVRLKVQDTFIQSFGSVFTNPLYIGTLCVLVGSNLVTQFLLMPITPYSAFYIDAVGVAFIVLAYFVLPKEFYAKKLILRGFALWLLGCNLVGFENLSEGLRQISPKASFLLIWPTIILYPLIYRGFLKEELQERILGFTYVIIFSFLLSRLISNILMLV